MLKKINQKELHEIFQDLKNKNQSAYNKLYENYYKLVYGIVFSIIKNKTDSEDITHEIFTKLYKLDSSKLPEDHEASWLYTVSKNECLLFIRKTKPNISIDEIYEMPENSNGIDDVIDKDYYNKLISGLKEDEKIIVSLKILSNFTFKKISQVMNIPIGTVQWKYYNAINSLKISIGSLVGAVLAFIVIIARGEFWKEKEYLRNNNDVDDNLSVEDNANEQSESSSEKGSKQDSQQAQQTEDNTDIQQPETNKADEAKNAISNQETKTITQANDKQEVPKKFFNVFDEIQITAIIVGITLFAVFIIFFKKYQQKVKKKSSK